MKKSVLVTLTAVVSGVMAFATFAQDELAFQGQIEARQSFMKVYRFNLGILGSMARGDVEYDAGAASAAANNLLAASQMNNSAMWPAGSDMSAPGYEGVTWAKADIWSSSDIGEKSQALKDALTEMAAAAGNGLGAVRSNIGNVADGCKGCHEPYRVSRD